MADTTFDSALEWLEENEAPDEVRAAFDKSKLRQQIAEAQGRISELEKSAKELERLKQAPVRSKALKDRGVDLEALSKAHKHLVDTSELDWTSGEAVAGFVSEWELPVSQAQPEPKQPSGAQQIVGNAAATTQAPVVTSKSVDQQIAELEVAQAEARRQGDMTEVGRLENHISALKVSTVMPGS